MDVMMIMVIILGIFWLSFGGCKVNCLISRLSGYLWLELDVILGSERPIILKPFEKKHNTFLALSIGKSWFKWSCLCLPIFFFRKGFCVGFDW